MTEKVRTPYPKAKMGYIHYLEPSDEWSRKAMENIIELGRIILTHKPGKMIDRHSGKERDVWGDDWNDRPADCNSGPPYGGEEVTLEAGDFVIVIKPTKIDEVANQIINLLCSLQSSSTKAIKEENE